MPYLHLPQSYMSVCELNQHYFNETQVSSTHSFMCLFIGYLFIYSFIYLFIQLFSYSAIYFKQQSQHYFFLTRPHSHYFRNGKAMAGGLNLCCEITYECPASCRLVSSLEHNNTCATYNVTEQQRSGCHIFNQSQNSTLAAMSSSQAQLDSWARFWSKSC